MPYNRGFQVNQSIKIGCHQRPCWNGLNVRSRSFARVTGMSASGANLGSKRITPPAQRGPGPHMAELAFGQLCSPKSGR
jgi:hypothetical protein